MLSKESKGNKKEKDRGKDREKRKDGKGNNFVIGVQKARHRLLSKWLALKGTKSERQ